MLSNSCPLILEHFTLLLCFRYPPFTHYINQTSHFLSISLTNEELHRTHILFFPTTFLLHLFFSSKCHSKNLTWLIVMEWTLCSTSPHLLFFLSLRAFIFHPNQPEGNACVRLAHLWLSSYTGTAGTLNPTVILHTHTHTHKHTHTHETIHNQGWGKGWYLWLSLYVGNITAAFSTPTLA